MLYRSRSRRFYQWLTPESDTTIPKLRLILDTTQLRHVNAAAMLSIAFRRRYLVAMRALRPS